MNDASTWEYRGGTVKLDEQTKRFHGSFDKETRWFDSYAEVTNWIDTQNAKTKVAARAAFKEPVLATGAVDVTITGLHSSRGDILYKPMIDSYQPTFYPVADWVREDLTRMKALKEEQRALVDRLNKVAIAAPRSWRNRTAESYAEAIEELRTNINAAREKAAKGRPS